MLVGSYRLRTVREWRFSQMVLKVLAVILGVSLVIFVVVIFEISDGVERGRATQILTTQPPAANNTPLTNASIMNLPPGKLVVAVSNFSAVIPVGELITVSRGGFSSGEFVQLVLASSPRTIGGGYADATGVITISATVPLDQEIGEHTLVLYGTKSGTGFKEAIWVIPSLNSKVTDITLVTPQILPEVSIPIPATTPNRSRLASTTTTTTTTTNPTVTETAMRLALTHESIGTASGAAFTYQPRIEIQDTDENRVRNSSAVVTATISAGGTLVGSRSATAVNGVAIFENLGISGTAGNTYTVTYTSGSLAVATQSITVTTGSAAKLVVTRSAVGNSSGEVFLTQPQVTIQDSGGNTVKNSSAVITAIISVGGSLVGSTSATSVNGVAEFSNLGIVGANGGAYQITFYTLSFLPMSPTVGVQSITVTTGSANYLFLTRPSQGTTPRVAFTVQPQITIRDSGGNTITSDSSTVVFATISSGGTLVGTNRTVAVAGVATFVDLGISGAAGTTYTITYYSVSNTTGSLGGATQSVTVSHGSATQLGMSRPSVGTASGVAFTTQPQVAILDIVGNTVTNSNAVVTAAITAGTGGALVGTVTATASGGVATFSNLGISGTAGVAYTITYSSTGLTSVTQSVTVTFGVATQLTITTFISVNGNVRGTAFQRQPIIAIKDANGNTVTNSSAVVTAAINGGGALMGSGSATAVNGVATFTGLGVTAGSAAGTYTITYSSTGLTSTSESVTVP